MKVTSDRKIQVSQGETLKLQSNTANLSLLGGNASAGQILHIQFPSEGGTHHLQATSFGGGNLTITSSLGEQWTTELSPGSNLFQFVVEPEPDDWYCENDNGIPPPHPVSKGDSICEYCGGKVIHRGN